MNAPANWCNKVSCLPYAAGIVKSESGATIQVTVTLRDSGSHVSDRGDPPGAKCNAGVCDVYVRVLFHWREVLCDVLSSR
jgi:hypothetical protein